MFVLPAGFRLKASVIASHPLDDELALLDLGTGTILVIPDRPVDALECGSTSDTNDDPLVNALLKAGFIERIDTVPASF